MDEATNLAVLETLVATNVRDAMQAAIVTGAAKLVFVANKDGFFTHPANTLIYAGLQALEERSVVHIAELLKTNIVRVPAAARRKAELLDHRDAISHPLVVKCRRPEMQKFHDEKRYWLDIRAALVWDFQRSINVCAGITAWSPLRHWKVGRGSRVAVNGFRGLGHMAVKLAHALGAEVMLLSTSPEKRLDAVHLGADEFLLSRDAGKLQSQLASTRCRHGFRPSLSRCPRAAPAAGGHAGPARAPPKRTSSPHSS